MNKNLLVYIAFACLLCFFLSSCASDGLSRAKAKRMIEEHYGFPLAQGVNRPNTLWKNRPLEANGLVENARITEFGYRFLIIGKRNSTYQTFMSNILAFDEVTGISMEENKAYVKINLVQKDVTPWGEGMGFGSEGKIYEKSVRFKKYDDGWRIVYPERIASAVVPLKDVPHLDPRNKLSH